MPFHDTASFASARITPDISDIEITESLTEFFLNHKLSRFLDRIQKSHISGIFIDDIMVIHSGLDHIIQIIEIVSFSLTFHGHLSKFFKCAIDTGFMFTILFPLARLRNIFHVLLAGSLAHLNVCGRKKFLDRTKPNCGSCGKKDVCMSRSLLADLVSHAPVDD